MSSKRSKGGGRKAPSVWERRAQVEKDIAMKLARELEGVKAELRAEVERLRAALQGIDALDPDVPDALVAGALRVIVSQMGEIARAALEGKS